MFEVCVLVNQVAEGDVVEIVFSTNENVEFLIECRKLAAAHQTAKVKFTEHSVELGARDSTVVDAVVIFKQREHLDATLTYTVR